MRKSLVFLLLVSGLIAACGDYQKVLKSTDTDYKYKRAVEYFENEKYDRAYPLFDELLTVYRGTEKAAEVYYYYAETSFRQDDYILAAYHFKNFAKTFPNHEKAEDAFFKVGYSHYQESPMSSLDQSYTYKAINDLQLFANMYPNSSKLLEANDLIDKLRLKLEKKAFDKALLYYNMESYQAAVVAFNNVLDEYPGTKFREEALYHRGLSAYRLASNSILSKQLQRYIECRTALKEFINAYPQSDYIKRITSILEDTEASIARLNSISAN